MRIKFSKYFWAYIYAFSGIYMSQLAGSIFFAFIGGMGIGIGIKMAYEAGRESKDEK